MSRRTILIALSLTILIGGSLSILGWKNLKARIETPQFKVELEEEISKVTGGQAKIATFQIRIRIRPSLSLQGFSLVYPEDLIRISTDDLRFDLKILPLIKNQIVFSEVRAESPRLIFKRPSNNFAEKMGALFPNKESDPKTLRIESLTVEDGQFTLIDPIYGTLLDTTADIETDFSPEDRIYHLRLTSNFLSKSKFPLQCEVVAASSGPLTLTATWTSTGTDATARINTNQWRATDYSCELTASRLDVAEVREAIHSFASSTTTVKIKLLALSSWTVHADWDLKKVALAEQLIPRLRGRATAHPEGGHVSELWTDAFGGELTAAGSWKMNSNPEKPALVKIKAKGQDIQLGKIFSFLGSPVPWERIFYFDLNLADLPTYFDHRMNGLEILSSLSKATSAQLNIGSEALHNESSILKNMTGTLAPDPNSRTLIVSWNVEWENGGLRGHGAIPHRAKTDEAKPLNIDLTIENMDLMQLPALANKLHMTKAKMNADIHWYAPSASEEMLRPFSPTTNWSFEGEIQHLVWRGISLENVTGRAAWEQNILRFENIQGNISSGSFLINGTLSNRTAEGFKKFNASGTLTDVEIAPVLAAFWTDPILYDGRFTGEANLSGEVRPYDPKSLTGSVVVTGRSGHIRSGSFLVALLTKLNLKSLIETVARKKHQGFPFDVVSGTGTIGGGRVTFEQPLAIKNSSLELAFTGWGSVDAQNAEGVVVVNPLVGTRNLLTKVPGVSTLVLGPDGEFLPLIVDITYRAGDLKTNFRSIQTLADLPLRIIGNVIRLPATIFGGGKKPPPDKK